MTSDVIPTDQPQVNLDDAGGDPGSPAAASPGRVVRILAPLRATPAGRLGVRVVITLLGLVVVAVGIVLVPLPGPGWLIIFAGLAIWSLEFRWAENLHRYARRRVFGWTAWLARQGWPVRIAVGVATALFLVAVVAVSLRLSFGPRIFHRLGALW